MHEILVAGVGRIGTLIGAMLADSGDYKVQLAERDGRLAEKVVGDYGLPNTQAFELDAGDGEAFAAHVRAWRPHAVIASLPYYLNVRLADIARAAGIHYSVVDLVLARPAEHRGFVPVERFRLADILANRFGRHFAAGGSSRLSGHLVATGQARRNGIDVRLG